jgi:hypothetical protein
MVRVRLYTVEIQVRMVKSPNDEMASLDDIKAASV